MADNLPAEILSAIARYLPQNDQSICVRVSRSWKAALTPVLYEIVRVKTRQQFRSLYKTLVETEHRNALGRHIRELRISHTMGFSRDAFESLPRLCPFLVIFDFDSRIWKNLRVSTTMEDWKHLRSLPQPLPSLQPRLKDYLLDKFGACFSEMTVHIEHRTQQDWLVLLEKMPKVEDLIIKGNDTHTTHGSPLISIAQLEKLHATKSALRSLSLRNINVYGDLPKDITLCTSMRKIELLSIADCLPLLLRYLTRKYAGLKSVYVEVEYDNLAVAQQKEITSALISLVTSHHQLEQFQVEQFRADQSILECFSPSTQALCVLHEYNAPILELSVDDNIGYWIATGIRYFHQTLSIVELRTARLKSIEEILLPLSMCPSLLQLSLEFYSDFYYQFDFGVNDILTYCKSIKTLKICAEKVSLGYGEHVRNLHNLEALIITTSDIDSDVLAYISDCCPRLSSLSCIYHSTAYIRDITFDMPKSRLDYLYFNCPDGTVYKLTQTDKPERILERRQKHYGFTNGFGAKSWTRWYHAVYPFLRKPRTERMTENEIRRLLKRGPDERQIVSFRCRSAKRFTLYESSLVYSLFENIHEPY